MNTNNKHNKNNKHITQITKIGIIAAMYVALCLIFAPISYGMIQFRVSEVLLVLPFYNKKYSISLILGTFIVNIFSPWGIIDMVFGTLATVLVCVMIIVLNNRHLIAITAAVINGIVIGAVIYFMSEEPIVLVLAMATVAVGEFVAVLTGVLLFMGVEKINLKFINLLKDL